MTTQSFEVQPYSPAILLVTVLVVSLAAFIASLGRLEGPRAWKPVAPCGRNEWRSSYRHSQGIFFYLFWTYSSDSSQNSTQLFFFDA